MRAADLKEIFPELAAAADEVLQNWDTFEGDPDDELGGGGICQDIASAMSGKLPEDLLCAEVYTEMDGGHVFLVVNLEDGVFRLDVPPHVYETGAGYQWQEKEGVRIGPDDIVLDKVYDPMTSREFAENYEIDLPSHDDLDM